MILVEFLNRRVLINESSFNSIDFDQEAETLTLESATDKEITTYLDVKGVHTKQSGDTDYFASNPHQNLLDEIVQTKSICLEAYHNSEKLHVLVCDTIREARCAETKEQIVELLKKLGEDRYKIQRTTPPFEEQQKEIRKNENEYIKQMMRCAREEELHNQTIKIRILEAQLESKDEEIAKLKAEINGTPHPEVVPLSDIAAKMLKKKPTDPRLGRAAKHACFNPLGYIINRMRRNNNNNN